MKEDKQRRRHALTGPLIAGRHAEKAHLGMVGVEKLHGANEGADDASKAHRAQHLAGQTLRLGALGAAHRLGRTCRQQGACQLHKGLHLRGFLNVKALLSMHMKTVQGPVAEITHKEGHVGTGSLDCTDPEIMFAKSSTTANLQHYLLCS